MATTSRAAQGTRGQWLGAGHGDLTGIRYVQAEEAKLNREAAIRTTRNAFTSGGEVTLVTVGDETYAVPSTVARALVEQGMHRD